jgi:hypothetical protein
MPQNSFPRSFQDGTNVLLASMYSTFLLIDNNVTMDVLGDVTQKKWKEKHEKIYLIFFPI